MVPSESMRTPEYPVVLDEVCGGIRRVRTLSTRHGREVFLVEDREGRFRVFKVHGNLSAGKLDDFLRLRKNLLASPASPYLLPLLAAGNSGGTGWEELALAEGVEAGAPRFQEYTPVQVVDELPRGVPGSIELAIAVGACVAKGLTHLGLLGLSHGDVKPSNVLRYDGRWVLADYDTMGSVGGEQQATASTEGYVPPGGEAGEERDCYALGKLLYELWTGRSRLEYPTLPEWLIRHPWGRRERVLNQVILALCATVSVDRPGLRSATTILEALESGDGTALRRAERDFPIRRRVWWKRSALAWLAGFVGLALVIGFVWGTSGWLAESLDGEPIALRVYREGDGLNDGYVRWTTDGVRKSLLMFNSHATLRRPLEKGEVVVIELKKEVWRGHVGLYLSDTPFATAWNPVFGHRENFGGLNHLFFFHVDGDTLAEPSGWKAGKPLVIPKGTWARMGARASLDTYTVSLEVMDQQYQWTVRVAGEVFAVGHMDRVPDQPAYLNVYVFDNTLCYLVGVSRSAVPAVSRP